MKSIKVSEFKEKLIQWKELGIKKILVVGLIVDVSGFDGGGLMVRRLVMISPKRYISEFGYKFIYVSDLSGKDFDYNIIGEYPENAKITLDIKDMESAYDENGPERNIFECETNSVDFEMAIFNPTTMLIGTRDGMEALIGLHKVLS